jgi:hypothetical protein
MSKSKTLYDAHIRATAVQPVIYRVPKPLVCKDVVKYHRLSLNSEASSFVRIHLGVWLQVDNPESHHSDSFYFVKDRLMIHNKASFTYKTDEDASCESTAVLDD